MFLTLGECCIPVKAQPFTLYTDIFARRRLNNKVHKPKGTFGSGKFESVNNFTISSFICAEPQFHPDLDRPKGIPSMDEVGTGTEISAWLFSVNANKFLKNSKI